MLDVDYFTPLQVCRIECASTLNFSTLTRLRINGHLEVSFNFVCFQTTFLFQITIFLLYFVVSYFLCLVTAVAELLDNAVDEVID